VLGDAVMATDANAANAGATETRLTTPIIIATPKPFKYVVFVFIVIEMVIILYCIYARPKPLC
jgi:hypothetical protein